MLLSGASTVVPSCCENRSSANLPTARLATVVYAPTVQDTGNIALAETLPGWNLLGTQAIPVCGGGSGKRLRSRRERLQRRCYA